MTISDRAKRTIASLSLAGIVVVSLFTMYESFRERAAIRELTERSRESMQRRSEALDALSKELAELRKEAELLRSSAKLDARPAAPVDR